MKPKKSQLYLGIMLAIMTFLAVVAFITPVKDEIVRARNESNLNCTDTSLTAAQKATCIQVDWALFAFVGAGLAIAFAYITLKKIKPE